MGSSDVISHSLCRRPGVLLACLAALFFPERGLLGQEPGPAAGARDREAPPTVEARRTPPGSEIRLDGLLNEEAWSAAVPATSLAQREPTEGAEPTGRTEIRVLFDDLNLYVGVTAHDPEPDAIVGRILSRDRLMEVRGGLAFGGDDAVAILFDTFHDHRSAMVFATNVNGAEFDALVAEEGRVVNVDWRGIWRVEARRTDGGWSAEFQIPFRTLRYRAGGGAWEWGFNVARVRRRNNEESLLAGWQRDTEGFVRVSRATHLRSPDPLPDAGLGAEITPFVLLGMTRPEADGSASWRTDVGADLRARIGTGLTLDVTLNPDFAQVEVDDQQVNLTRFPLFFPEKRGFFLENAGVFEFGNRGTDDAPPFLMFFSRRIGVANEEEVPVLGGARVSGREGALTLGLLNVVSGETAGAASSNYGVARVTRDLGGGHVGVMVTDRRGGGETNTVGGLDWSLWPHRSLNLRGYVAGTQTSGEGGDDLSYFLSANFQGDVWGFHLRQFEVGPEARADVGFIERTDIRTRRGVIRTTARPQLLGLRRIDSYTFGVHSTTTAGRVQDWYFGHDLSPTWNSGDFASLYALRRFTRVDEPFDLGGRVRVPASDYDEWELGASLTTSPSRPVRGRIELSAQRFFGGDLFSVGGELTVNPTANFLASLRLDRSRVALPGGAFTSRILGLRSVYAFSTRVQVAALLQHNDLDDRASINVRAIFNHRPGSDLVLAFTEERATDRAGWALSSRGVVLKLAYVTQL